MVTDRPNIAPAIGGWLARFRYYVEPDAFSHAMAGLENHKALMDQMLRDIEGGAETERQHMVRMQRRPA